MTWRRIALGLVALLAIVAVVVGLRVRARQQADRRAIAELGTEIAALEAERETLRQRLEALIDSDPRAVGMPETPVRLAVPTTLAADLIRRVLNGVVNQVTLELRGLRVRKRGTVRKVVRLGDYDLRVTVNRVVGTLKPARPELTFGGNRVALSMPVTLAGGSGNATIDFAWDGRTVGGAVCGDMTVTQRVTGTVRPRTYPVSGRLELTSTATEILLVPRLPRLRINLRIAASEASWQAAQKILDDKGGLCGFVLDRVNVMGHVERLIDRGFNVRIPTEKVRSVALPIMVEPTMMVAGAPVALNIRVGGLAVTEHMIWLGAHVSVAVGDKSPPS